MQRHVPLDQAATRPIERRQKCEATPEHRKQHASWTRENLREELENRAFSILRWATFALRPLTVLEITEALIVTFSDNDNLFQLDEMPDTIDNEYIKSEIIDICGALVEVRAEGIRGGAAYKTVHLIHPSVREYLLSAL
jgi:hypothetical protein